MSITGMELTWIVVTDFKQAIKFYTETIGLEVKEVNEQFGWAELSGKSGARLGIAQSTPQESVKPGSNGIVTITVTDLDARIAAYKKSGVILVGEVVEIPGMCRMQLLKDSDGNHFQIYQGN